MYPFDVFMARRIFIFFVIFAFLSTSTGPSWAVKPLLPGAYPHAVRDMIHHPSEARMLAAGSLHAATLATATGSKNVAVIIVQFPAGNASLISGSRSIQSVSTIKGYFDAMKAYYSEASYGLLILNFIYFNSNTGSVNGDASPSPGQAGVYTLAHPTEYYGCWDEGQGCGNSVTTPTTSANGNYLTRDAIDAARGAGGTGLISVDKGGMFDAVIVVHAGDGNETVNPNAPKNGTIWSIFYSQDTVIRGTNPIDAAAATAGFTEGDVVPETETGGISSPLGVMCHEFGHSLGLPDLYNTTAIGGSSVTGPWEIMDSGPYDGVVSSDGSNPSHPSAWDKMTLGWVTPTVATTKLNTTLSYAETAASLLRIPIQDGLAQEYFLVEYRSRTSGATYDRGIPGSGLLIWHVDDAITSSRGINVINPGEQNTVNTGSPHYGVSLVTADGIPVSSNGGDANNPFGNNHTFTSPTSNNFAGQPSGISIVNISGVGSATASLQVVNLGVAAGQKISKLTNYPNPAGKGYAHPNGEGHTTLQMQLTRPASDFGFNIYTLSGDLVRKIGMNDITLNTVRSADEKWVYEFVWDLKNGDGKMVAPGVYLYLARADGETKSGKAVIIR